MKNFYSVEPKHDFKGSSSKYENVEYDINTLIRDQAELWVNADDDYFYIVKEEINYEM